MSKKRFIPVVDEGKCTECGICEAECPWDAIILALHDVDIERGHIERTQAALVEAWKRIRALEKLRAAVNTFLTDPALQRDAVGAVIVSSCALHILGLAYEAPLREAIEQEAEDGVHEDDLKAAKERLRTSGHILAGVSDEYRKALAALEEAWGAIGQYMVEWELYRSLRQNAGSCADCRIALKSQTEALNEAREQLFAALRAAEAG